MDTKNIILIEDESMLRGVLTEMLEEVGYTVQGFVDAETAFEHMKVEKPDVIITDLVLPNIDGFGVIKKIKVSVDMSDVPVLILSNLGDDKDMDRAMELGASDFLIKSNVSLEQIVTRIKKVLGSGEKKGKQK